jgi:hypothetical protein
MIECSYIPEPLLQFAEAGFHVDPKAGIARYGPASWHTAQHPKAVTVGLIGTAEMMAKTEQWLISNAEGVDGTASQPDFPGYGLDRGFFSELVFDEQWRALITQTELHSIQERSDRLRFELAIGLIDEKLRLLSERDRPPMYIVIALPEEFLVSCAVVQYEDALLGVVHRNFRRAVKAATMQYRIPTQFVRERLVEGKDPDVPCKIAWNFFTGLYTKAGGIPWGPHGLTSGTCYIGIGFYQALGSTRWSMQTSLVQAFDERGEGLILRGHDFEWDSVREDSRSPHLSDEQAASLVDLVLNRYKQEIGQTPQRVVVHKTSRYWPQEREGFSSALRSRVSRFDLVALDPFNSVRLMPVNKYPPLRGTFFRIGELDYLYTTGFIPELNEFHGIHVPSPVQIADHIGQDTPRNQLLGEILALTKMNWNAARLGGRLPITLKFSELVGDILREVPADRDPLPQFKFYM